MKWNLTLDELVAACQGTVLSRHVTQYSGVCTDSRKPMAGQIFFALKGDRFDAHKFVGEAQTQGAAALVVHELSPAVLALKEKITIIQVPDTLLALQALAHYWRERHKYTVVAISGSNGKTSSKEFARAIVGPHRACFASHGSFNNHWGVPLSLLAATPEHQVVVQEMGMNHTGELARLVEIAEPDIVVCTMVGSAHIGELGSQIAVAQAKEELYIGAPHAQQIFNIDNEWTIGMFERARARGTAKRILTFSSFRPEADIYLRAYRVADFRLEVKGRIMGVEGEAVVPVVGRHNVNNLMVAASVAVALGLTPQTIWSEMPKCHGAWGRNQLLHLPSGAKVLFDAYNANPESMAALVKSLLEFDVTGQRVVVMGEMMELGAESAARHRELGALVARAGVDLVWFIGPHKADFEAGLKAENFRKTYYISDSYEQELALKIGSVLNDVDLAVIKGSRAMKLEQVLLAWQPIDFSSH